METITSTAHTSTRRLPVLLALALIVLPIVAYAIQFHFRYLQVPWYVPILTTVGALCMAWAVFESASIGRIILFVLVGLLTAAEWAFFVLILALPAYTGPAEVGKPFPVFQVARADGSLFTQDDLRGSQENVLVFFRGRW
jgi:hypothetical protein